MIRMRSRLLPCAAAVVLLLSSTVAQDAANGSTTSSATSTSGLPSNRTSEETSSNLTTVDQAVPVFTGIRSCLPFNILIAAAPGTSDSSSSSTDGRILIQADYSVINSTVAAVEDGILTLSLAGGFETHQPVNFTVVVPAGSDLRSVANAGSGLVVLGPGHKVTSLRLVSPTVGQIEAVNLTADSVSMQSSGVLGGIVSGAIKKADIASTGTGSIAFTSTTPVQMSVQLSGITTVVANIPQGSSITGTAGGLSKVQYTNGQCSVTSDTPLLFPAPSIFGGSGFGFGLASRSMNQKCQQLSAAELQPAAAAAENPQWSCGIIVDGSLSCQAVFRSNATQIPWNVTAPPAGTEATSTGAATPATNAANNTGSTSATTAGNTGTPSIESIGVDNTGTNSSGARVGNAASIAVEPPAGDAAGAGRRMLQLVTTPTTTPPGQITTGAQTSGPGSFASGTGSVSGPGGSATQQTSSQGGSQPQTTISTGGVGSNIYNPVYVPATPAQNIAAQANLTTNETAEPSSTTSPSTTAPTIATSTATSGGGGAPVVRTSTSGPGTSSGIAVASTACASRAQSLSMLVQPLQGATAGSAARNIGTGAVGGAGSALADTGPSASAVSSATSSAGASPTP